MPSLLDAFLLPCRGGQVALLAFSAAAPATQPQTDAQSQQANQAWLSALMGATQGVPKDPYSSPSMLMPGPYGVKSACSSCANCPRYFYDGNRRAPQPAPAPPTAYPMTPPQGPMQPLPTQNVAPLPAPQGPPQTTAPIAAPAAALAAARPSFFGGLNNYIDQNRASLMALAGGLASGGIGPGFWRRQKYKQRCNLNLALLVKMLLAISNTGG